MIKIVEQATGQANVDWINRDTARAEFAVPPKPRLEPGTKGDVSGHAFHGNRYTGGIGGGDRQEQVEALKAYRGNEYGMINDMLRGSFGPDTHPQASDNYWRDLHDRVDAIHGAMKPLAETTTVYRAIGMGGSEALLGAPPPLGGAPTGLTDEEVSERLQALVGGVIEDKAFVSTTQDKEMAGAKTNRAPILFEISIPAGTPVVDMNQPGVRDETYAYEKELLLDHGSRFHVDAVIGPTSDYSTEYPVHVLKLSVVR